MPTLTELSSSQDQRLHCSKCKHVTELPGIIRINYEDGSKALIRPFQCNFCGMLDMQNQLSDESINAKCECGGTLKIDDPFFCDKCLHGKL